MQQQPFGTVVRDLLISRGITTGMGNPNWVEFVERLPTLGYETIRKAVTAERAPSLKIMEEVAAALDVEPSIFFEYQLAETQRQFDPREVGVEQALANLLVWKEAQPKRSAQKRSRTQAA